MQLESIKMNMHQIGYFQIQIYYNYQSISCRVFNNFQKVLTLLLIVASLNNCFSTTNAETEKTNSTAFHASDCGIGSLIQPSSGASYRAVPDSVPWQAAIYKKSNENRSKYDFICGGTILSPTLIISAAHCFYDSNSGGPFDASEFEVAVGKYTIMHELIDKPHTKIIKAKKVHIPKTFMEDSLTSDIAILELIDAINVSSKIMPICIDQSQRDGAPPIRGQVAGWGLTENETFSEVLRIANLVYLPSDACMAEVKSEWFRRSIIIQPDKFCAADKPAGIRIGDAGGGWIYKVDGRYQLYGVGIFRESIATRIAAFTRIAPYFDWIDGIKKMVQQSSTDAI